jgi:flavin reductase (DIM6/NTAB) family NADH-FMN oxidoreductase RutF
MMEFEPPLIGCVISARNYSFDLLQASRECVFNIPTAELGKQVVGIGNSSGKKLDKFEKFGLTPRAASCVQAPLIAECYANLECKVADRKLVASYNFFILEVLQAWIVPGIKEPQTLHHRGQGMFMVAGPTIKLASRMK